MCPRSTLRKAVQAGRFYPADSKILREAVEKYLESARPVKCDVRPIGYISPHAGYEFSGATAGHTYRVLQERQPSIIFLFGPSHHVAFPLVAFREGSGYETPLGEYPMAQEIVEGLQPAITSPGIVDWADELEHSLEVQVPFLQLAAPKARMVPLLMGSQDRATVETVAQCVGDLCEAMNLADVAFVASSDAYHGSSLKACRDSDDVLAERIEAVDLQGLYRELEARRAMACGFGPIATVMELSRRFGAEKGRILHHSTSADAIPHSPGDYVVGYLSAVFC